MNNLGDFHFIRPAWLLLAPVVTWVWWRRTHRAGSTAWLAQGDGSAIARCSDCRTDRQIRPETMQSCPVGDAFVQAPGVVGGCSSPGGWPAVFGGTNMASRTLALRRRSHTGDARAQGGRDDGSGRPCAKSHGTCAIESRRLCRGTDRSTARAGCLCGLGTSCIATDPRYIGCGDHGSRDQSGHHAQAR